MDKPTMNKTDYALVIARKIPMSEMISDGGTKTSADEMDVEFVKLNDLGMYLCIDKKAHETIIVQLSDTVCGCACEEFTKSDGPVVCKHIVKLRSLFENKKYPQKRISNSGYEGVRELLLSHGWNVKDKMLYPSPDDPTHDDPEPPTNEAEASGELPPDESSWAPDEDELDTTEPPKEPTKKYSRTCEFCEYVAYGDTVDEAKKTRDAHQAICPDNPKNKNITNAQEPEPPSTDTEQESEMLDIPSSEDEDPTPTKMYKHPDGTEFSSQDALLDYIDDLEDGEQHIDESTFLAPMIQNLGPPRLSEVGGIRIGQKTGRSAMTFDHFIFTKPDKDPVTGHFYRDEALTELYGNCTELPVRLLSDDITECFTTFYAEYGKGGWKIRGDGKNWIVKNSDGSKTYIKDPEGKRGFLGNPNIKPQGILTVLVDGQESVGSVYRYRTTGWNSINGMLASLALCADIAKRAGGRIAFLPMMLIYRTKEVIPKGEQYKKTIPVITVEYRGTLEDLQERSREAMNYLGAGVAQLAYVYDAGAETPEEQEDVRAEFFPEER